jgi:hypothetical protein
MSEPHFRSLDCLAIANYSLGAVHSDRGKARADGKERVTA